MIHVFLEHIQKNKLWEPTDRLLLAVSGGSDSMALLHLCWKAGFSVEVAHVNYGLRGEDANLDQMAVQTYCQIREIPCHIHRLSEDEIEDLKAGNLQKKARDIRYAWMENLRKERGLAYLLTAHHAQDQAETFVWHVIRGTGLRGLGGILEANGPLRRPLLFAQPDTLRLWLAEEQIPWRLDASNLSSVYTRNQIRHDVLPVLASVRPGALAHVAEVPLEIQGVLPFLAESWENFQKTNTKTHFGVTFFSSVQWIVAPTTAWMLAWWLRPHGFNPHQLENIRQAIHSSETNVFTGLQGFTVWVNKHQVGYAEYPGQGLWKSDFPLTYAEPPAMLVVGKLPREEMEKIEVEVGKIQWPISFRTRQAGDRVKGPSGRRKVSDWFIDRKVPVFLRDQWPILVDVTGEIIWIPGLYLAPHLRATETSPETVKFYAEPWISP